MQLGAKSYPSHIAKKSRFLYLLSPESIVWCIYSSSGGGKSLPLQAGSSLRHWPPGTNSKTFVPSFFFALEAPILSPISPVIGSSAVPPAVAFAAFPFYSIFGIGVVRKHAPKWLFPQEEPPFTAFKKSTCIAKML